MFKKILETILKPFKLTKQFCIATYHSMQDCFKAIKNEYTNSTKRVGIVGKIVLLSSAAAISIYHPYISIMLAMNILSYTKDNKQHRLINHITMFGFGIIFYLIGCIATELLIPFVYLSLLSLIGYLNYSYERRCNNEC